MFNLTNPRQRICPELDRSILVLSSQDECRRQNDCQQKFCPLSETFDMDQNQLINFKISGGLKT